MDRRLQTRTRNHPLTARSSCQAPHSSTPRTTRTRRKEPGHVRTRPSKQIHCTMVIGSFNGMPLLSVDQNLFYYACFWMFIHVRLLDYILCRPSSVTASKQRQIHFKDMSKTNLVTRLLLRYVVQPTYWTWIKYWWLWSLTQTTSDNPTLPHPFRTPVGLTNIPEPIMLPTITVTPLNSPIDLCSLMPDLSFSELELFTGELLFSVDVLAIASSLSLSQFDCLSLSARLCAISHWFQSAEIS